MFSVPATREPMPDVPRIHEPPLRCLWLTRVYPAPPDAGDLTYSFHLLSSLSRAGVRLTVLAMRRTADRARAASENGIKWVVVPSGKGSRNRRTSCGAEPVQPPSECGDPI